jgi:hypothetical protein
MNWQDEDFLERAQTDLEAALRSDASLADVPVLVARKGVIANDVAERLGLVSGGNGKSGLALIVRMPTVEVTVADASGPPLTVRAEVEVRENPVLNGGLSGFGTSAERIALRLLKLLHGYRPGLSGGGELRADSPAIKPLETGSASQVGYILRLKLDGNPGQQTRWTTPALVVTGGASGPWQLSAAGAPGGAALYYTIDGSFPWAGNAAAAIYSGPVTLSEGGVVRAAVHGEGRSVSHVVEALLGAE